MKELLEAGVHFGHQTKRWNPKMKDFIFGERNGIYIIDLQKTHRYLQDALQYVQDLAAQGKSILFVGTKRQAQEAIAEEAQRCGSPVRERALAGRAAHQLRDRAQEPRPPEGPRRDVHRRPARAPHQEGSRAAREGARQAGPEPARHQGHEERARRHLRDRHAQGGDRGPGGAQAEDPRHRASWTPTATRTRSTR